MIIQVMQLWDFEVLGENGAVLVNVRLLECCRVAQILQLQEHVAVFENHLERDANMISLDIRE